MLLKGAAKPKKAFSARPCGDGGFIFSV